MPRINQLPAASSVDATDVVAVDTQNGTKRVPKSTLFTGYYTAAEVDEAIAQSTANRAYFVTLDSSDDTIAKVSEKLYALPLYQTATILCDTTPTKLLSTNGSATNPKIAEPIYGTVFRRTTDSFRFMVRISQDTMILLFTATVTSSTITTNGPYKFTGSLL